MSCLPHSGGCERQRVEPFVQHINAVEGYNFIHIACLDRIYLNSPQPEALYKDDKAAETMVIERKAIVWPPDYAKLHASDHRLASLISERLRPMLDPVPYLLNLETAVRGSEAEIVEFAERIAQTIIGNLSIIRAGETIGSQRVGRRWSFRIQKPGERDDDDPETGIMFFWNVEESHIPYSHSNDLPDGLRQSVQQIFLACKRKFTDYAGARKILLLNPHGDVKHVDPFWWNELLVFLGVPNEIDEIWLSSYDWISFNEQGWTFECVYPWSKENQDNQRLTRC